MKFNVTCPRCGGTGKNRTVCPVCHGEGTGGAQRVAEGAHQAGHARRPAHPAAGRGNAGTMGAPAGDLYIIVRVGEHPVFKRESDDIHLTVPVSVTEAAMGAKIEVPTIDGRALLKIPPGTQPGRSCGCARKVCRRR